MAGRVLGGLAQEAREGEAWPILASGLETSFLGLQLCMLLPAY